MAADLPVRRVEVRSCATWKSRTWPYSIPAVTQPLSHGLDLPQATILEGVAEALGFNACHLLGLEWQ